MNNANREIKFRAWHNVDWVMYYNHSVNLTIDGAVSVLSKSGEWEQDDDRSMIDLMQFTGLLDKNGKEIYEGDVLNIDTTNSDGNVVGESKEVVRFEGAYILPLSWITAPYVEIIGNIYENPDLLNTASYE